MIGKPVSTAPDLPKKILPGSAQNLHCKIFDNQPYRRVRPFCVELWHEAVCVVGHARKGVNQLALNITFRNRRLKRRDLRLEMRDLLSKIRRLVGAIVKLEG